MSLYHVRISLADTSQADEVKLDLSRDELEQRFVEPYKRGQTIVINGRPITIDQVKRISISNSEQDSSYLAQIVKQDEAAAAAKGVFALGIPKEWLIADKAEDVTDLFIAEPPGSHKEERILESPESQPATDAREVFVVHGRNNPARDALFEFLRALDLRPLEWSEAAQSTGKPSPYIGEILNAAFSRAHAVAVLFTPDDEARLKESLQNDSEPQHETKLTGQARPNVLFEAGMAMARHQDRTIFVELGHLRPFTDISGLHVIRMDDSSERRQQIAQRLEAAGCPVNREGTDWHTAGDFEAALEETTHISEEEAVVADEQPTSHGLLQLSEEARELLMEAVKDKSGIIRKVRLMGGMSIGTNRREFTEKGNPRLEATWASALRELEDNGFVIDETGSDQVFRVTGEGYKAADTIEG